MVLLHLEFLYQETLGPYLAFSQELQEQEPRKYISKTHNLLHTIFAVLSVLQLHLQFLNSLSYLYLSLSYILVISLLDSILSSLIIRHFDHVESVLLQ